MTARIIGLVVGATGFALACFAPLPGGLAREGLVVAGLVWLMASWWMTEAIPLTATALTPFIVLPFAGVMDAGETASAYYSPILFLLLGFVLLVGGGELLVRGAVRIAERLGLSPMLIGLTIVGLGTSTPELAASVQAAARPPSPPPMRGDCPRMCVLPRNRDL